MARPWDTLNEGERTRLAWAFFTLKEFTAGYIHLHAMTAVTQPGSSLDRFLTNGLFHYIHAFFLGPPGSGIRPVLDGLDACGLYSTIDVALGATIGDATMSELLTGYRNKMLAHPTFTPKHVEKHVLSKFDQNDPDVVAQFEAGLRAVMDLTRQLYVALEAAYPELSVKTVDNTT